MSSERWLEIESRILTAIAEGPEGSEDEVNFDGAGWQKGVKVVGCGNKKSYDFLKRVIDDCGELWQGAKLEVVPRAELPLRQIISIWIPPPAPEDETIMKIITRQNKGLNTQSWKVISSAKSKSGNDKDIVIAVDAESITCLRTSKGSIKFGLGGLKARLPNDKKETKDPGSAGGAN